VQVGGDVDFDSGAYLGIWGSTVDIYTGSDRQRDYQVNYYAGYSFDLGNRWSLGMNVVAYRFPGQKGSVDYDYEEVTVSANYRDVVWLEYSWSPDLYSTGNESQNIDLLAEWPLPGELILGAGGGYYDTSELTGIGYGYWHVGVSKEVGVIDIDVRFHDTNRPVPIISNAGRADQRFSVTGRIRF